MLDRLGPAERPVRPRHRLAGCHKVLLPGVTTLERNIARVRACAAQRLWRQMLMGITADQRDWLEALLVPPGSARQSPLDRLRDGPVLQSPAELARALEEGAAW